MLNSNRAIAAIEKHGLMLVFPIDNARDPHSIWYEFFPRTKMRWEWDANGDDRVPDLWHLREKLATSRRVLYTKWYRGRATCLSPALFMALQRILNDRVPPLSRTAREILDILEDNSPVSSKLLKKAADLQGRDNEAAYTRALKELWERLLIVGYGEVDDGAFPSLAIGSSKLLFENLWNESKALSLEEAKATAAEYLGVSAKLMSFYRRLTMKNV